MSEEEDHGGSGEEEESPASDSNDVQPIVLEATIMMLQQIGFAISSLFVGVSLDSNSPKTLFAAGMFLTGFFNFGFSDVDETTNLMLLATMVGITNGFGWPCAVQIVRNWFPSVTFGLWWAMISLSYFIVNLVGPPMANSWATDHGWRVAIQMPAVISMVVSTALYFMNFDKPSDVGYTDQESEKDWGQLYLMEERGLSTYNAGFFGKALEFGGAVGTVFIGAIADFAVKHKMSIGYYNFPRMILLFISLFGGGIILSSFILGIDAYSGSMEVNFYGFIMGLTFCAALQNLEVMTIETSPPNKLSSCYALVNFSMNMAAVMAGFPMSFLAAHYGWSRAFLLLNFALLVAFFALIIGKDLDKNFNPPAIDQKSRSSV
ncbi:SLC37A4 [Bugula neritina]|uniref:SLC37A4 n=1 Tax=Bugula neritina TaxID=10212 RepID=A0A7J7KK30_BUGNE|nr:SLC37A4 [Bugula neritina]